MRLAVAVCWLAVFAGCTDPGCIRHSECGAGYRCLEALCVRVVTDAGADDDAGR